MHEHAAMMAVSDDFVVVVVTGVDAVPQRPNGKVVEYLEHLNDSNLPMNRLMAMLCELMA